jgi:hypothetical protein
MSSEVQLQMSFVPSCKITKICSSKCINNKRYGFVDYVIDIMVIKLVYTCCLSNNSY